MTHESADASQLLLSIQAGDRTAFDRLVQAQTRRLLAIAHRITGDEASAEDVVQETFMRILEGRAMLRRLEAAEAWLARVATRIAIDVLRRRSARAGREATHVLETEPARRESALSPLDRTSGA